MTIYVMPMIVFISLVFRKNISSNIRDYCLVKKKSNNHKNSENKIRNKIKDICTFLDTQVPIIKIVDSWEINAKTKYTGFPIFKNVLIISQGTLEELSEREDELEILLAHEIWHIKNHTLPRRFLCFLSDYSLFGNGFLALLQNSFRLERDADDFAVQWISQKHQDDNFAIDTLKSLLETIEETSWKNALLRPNITLNFSIVKDSCCRNTILRTFNNSSKIERIRINFYLLYQMYLGEDILSYFHPSIDQRITWVLEKHGTKSAN